MTHHNQKCLGISAAYDLVKFQYVHTSYLGWKLIILIYLFSGSNLFLV